MEANSTQGYQAIRYEILKCQTHRTGSCCLSLIDWCSPPSFERVKEIAVQELNDAGYPESAAIVVGVTKKEYYLAESL